MTSREMRPVVIAGAFFALIIVLVLAIGPQGDTSTRPRPSSGLTDHSVLQRDAEMTQRMGVPGTPGAMEQGRVVDQQLRHSQDPSFVADLEQHQADIDRMLAEDGR